jgi:hypothetical protein
LRKQNISSKVIRTDAVWVSSNTPSRTGVSPMVPPIAHVVFPDGQSDLYLTQAVARLSSSPSAREAACAWLAAYDVARANGAPHCEAIGQAEAALHLAVDCSTRSAPTGQVEETNA